MVPNSVFLRTPASAGNVGPGHDCFGLAFDLFNDFQFTLKETPDQVELIPRGFCTEQDLSSIPLDSKNLAIRSFKDACEQWQLNVPAGLHVTMTLGIPINRGLGSSATARVAGVLAARAFLDSDNRISDQDVNALASQLEKHPDNALPCLHGGFTISVADEGRLHSFPIPVPSPPTIALCIPKNLEISTAEARRALPASYSKADAVFSASRAALLASALATGQHQLLRDGVVLQDQLHEPFRGRLIPGFLEARKRACEAGAYGLVISGSGPTLLVLAESEDLAKAAGNAVKDVWAALDISCWIRLSSLPKNGALGSVELLG